MATSPIYQLRFEQDSAALQRNHPLKDSVSCVEARDDAKSEGQAVLSEIDALQGNGGPHSIPNEPSQSEANLTANVTEET